MSGPRRFEPGGIGDARGERSREAASQPTLQSISVGKDESVWGISKAGNALRSETGLAPSWSRLESGPVSWVAVGLQGESYGIAGGLAVKRPTEDKGPWERIENSPRALRMLSVGYLADEQPRLAAIDKSGKGWGWVPSLSKWLPLNWGVLEVISGADDGSIAFLVNGEVRLDEEHGPFPKEIPAPEKIASLACGAKDDLWAIGESGTVFHYDGGTTWKEESRSGQFTSGTISAGSDGTVWVLSATNALYAYEPKQGEWKSIGWTSPDPPKHICVASKDEIWAVDAAGDVYRYTTDPNIWLIPPGYMGPSCIQVATVEAGLVWTLDPSGTVRECRAVGGGWDVTVAAGLEAKWIAASGDETLALDANGAAHLYAGGDWHQLSSAPELVSLAVAEGNLRVALDKAGVVYHWSTEGQAGWVALPATTPPVASIAMTDGGAVLALDTSHGLWLYLEKWVQCVKAPSEGLASISLHDVSNAWGVTQSGVPVSLGTIGEVEAPSSVRRLPGWDTESVTDETASTHLWIVNRGATLARKQGERGERVGELVNPSGPTTAFRQQLCQGLYDADFLPAYNNPTLLMSTWKSHFYDPDTGTNWLGETEPTALTQGKQFYLEAAQEYRQRELATAGYKLGLALHYLTDLTQPMHAANFTWLSSAPMFGYHSHFEAYVMEIQASVGPPTTYQAVNWGPQPERYLQEAARKSKASYYNRICPDEVKRTYFRFSAYYQTLARAWAPAMLFDAITITSQFLVAWMEYVESLSKAGDEVSGSQVESAP